MSDALNTPCKTCGKSQFWEQWDATTEYSYRCLSCEYKKLRTQLQAAEERIRKLEKVRDVAEENAQRLMSLPWFRSDGGSDAPYCLSYKVWQAWNYGTCEKLHDAIKACEEKEPK